MHLIDSVFELFLSELEYLNLVINEEKYLMQASLKYQNNAIIKQKMTK